MLTIKKFREDIYSLFKLMAHSDAYLDVAYKGRKYRVYVEDVGPAPSIKRKKRKYATKRVLKQGKCPLCGGLTIEGVCLSPVNHLESMPEPQ